MTVSQTDQFNEERLLTNLRHYLPAQASLKDFVHHNSLHSHQDLDFFTAIFAASKTFGMRVTLSIEEYRALYHEGRISTEILYRVLDENVPTDDIHHWLDRMTTQPYHYQFSSKVGTLRDQWKKVAKRNIDDAVHPTLFRLLGAFLDQGVAIKHFPNTNLGLVPAIISLSQQSFVCLFRSKRVRKLLDSPEELTVENLLTIVVGDARMFEQYVLDQQFAHKGWSGLVAAIERQPDTLLYQKNINLTDVIILELLLEIDVLDTTLGPDWAPLCSHTTWEPIDYFSPEPLDELEQVLKLWHLAFEWSYYDEVLAGIHTLAQDDEQEYDAVPSFQAVFCVDDREDSIRRHMEFTDPKCETLGAPGYFDVAIMFEAFGAKFRDKNCPVPVTPTHLIRETGRKHSRSKDRLQTHDSHTLAAGLTSSLALGGIAAFRFIADLFDPTQRADSAISYAKMDIGGVLKVEADQPPEFVDGLQIGYTVAEMADIVEGFISTLGIQHRLAPLVYLIAHGSSTANNPHHSAYDCGACSGRPGGVNARVFATMANHPGVRKILRDRGIAINVDTHFLGGMHDTASDEIRFYDRSAMSQLHYTAHQTNVTKIEQALDLNALERSRRFASIDSTQPLHKIRKDIYRRSVSYAEPRPEYCHGTNALCFVGNRPRFGRVFVDRRAFHQSYDYREDTDGTLLQKVLGPLPIVCGGINLEYYFSRMDIERMGAGTKLPHHVMGLFGVTNSAEGDIRTGLHLQTVETHDPIRLLMVVEHDPEILLSVLQKTPVNFRWFTDHWIHLVALRPADQKLYRLVDNQFEEYVPLATIQHNPDLINTFRTSPVMEANHIVHSTRENLPVQIVGRR